MAGNVKHVVLLMFENHSFDNMLGWLKKNNSAINGLTGAEFNPTNPADPNSPKIYVTDAGAYRDPDPDHSVDGTALQIYGTTANQAFEHDPAHVLMNGFVASYNATHGKGAVIMDCFDPVHVPVITTLASEFALFDEYFPGVPGPTFPNRLFSMSATSDGYGDNSGERTVLGWPQDPIFQRLDEVNASWRVYFEDGPTSLLFQYNRKNESLRKHHFFSKFYEDAAKGDLPSFTWLDPAYLDIPPVHNASDQHPAHDVALGEALLARVYNALRASPVWNETALIVTYDEHGGFFDHVPTPVTGIPSPDGKKCVAGCDNTAFEFTRLGVRVPFIVASPWVPKGLVVHGPANSSSFYEHSSIPASLHNIFGTRSFLNARDAAAAPWDWVLSTLQEPRTDCPQRMPEPPASSPVFAPEAGAPAYPAYARGDAPVSHLQQELLALVQGVAGARSPAEAAAVTARLGLTTEKAAGRYMMREMRRVLRAASAEE